MGSPFLGDFEGVEKETGKLMFSLEANNFVDEVCDTLLHNINYMLFYFFPQPISFSNVKKKGNSKQTQAPYFESGWVDEKDIEEEEKRKGKGGFRLW
jgi:hypothetical protein